MNEAQVRNAKQLETEVWQLVDKKQLKQAIVACQHLNREFPDYPSGWHSASQLAMHSNRVEAALNFTEKAIDLDPENTSWLVQKALCLCHLRQTVPFSELVDDLVTRDSLTAFDCTTLGMLLTQLERREEAIEFYRRAIELKPGQSQHYYNIAVLQRSLGHIDDAEQNFNRAIGLNPKDYEAYKVRSELRVQTKESNHVKTMEKLLRRGIDDLRGRAHVCFALAKELEDLQEWQPSFQYLKAGADTRRSYIQYDAKRDLRTMSVIAETYDESIFDGAIAGNDNAEAIFILGMPRSGTTLVERILSSHSDVFAAGELGNFTTELMSAVSKTSSVRKPGRDELVRITKGLNFEKLGEAYINSTRPATAHKPRFIDKLPINYLYAGLIHLALPNAKIINLYRNPMDTCYAVYKQLFVDGYPFSYNLEELGHYYVAYHRLMAHWNRVMPGVIHTIGYEDLVNDTEGESKRLLGFCDLDWQEEVLKFYENKAASTTASASQVRQPIYKSSVAKWRHYEDQLEPLLKILRNAGIEPA
ncbi:MAG: tetratricopeptide (TPR) repeat protein [Lysobacterales bacterium]